LTYRLSSFLRIVFLLPAWFSGRGCLYGQDVVISGLASAYYSGKPITLSSAKDYITFSPFVESRDTVDAQGNFELYAHVTSTCPLWIECNQVKAKLYAEPGQKYELILPEPDPSDLRKNGSELHIEPTFKNHDSTELNALIADYQALYNRFFIPPGDRFISRARMFRLADSLQAECGKRYRKTGNEYFQKYLMYSLASLNAALSRGEKLLINAYVLGKPILYRHHEYMQFFNTCFKGYLLSLAAQKKGESLHHMINSSSDYLRLLDLLQQDEFMRNDSLAELVIIRNLWDMYYAPEFSQDAVKSIVSQLHNKTMNETHKEITAEMLSKFSQLLEGSAAPDFTARTRDGKLITLSSLKGKWIYLNFFSAASLSSLKEMPKIASLKKKYGDKVTFVSVCLDDSLSSYVRYLRNNPRFDWPVLFAAVRGMSQTARERYAVTGSEGYFLIQPNLTLAMSPALSPSSGIEFRFNTIFRIKKRNTKTGIR
jgi:hypothetical protein